jgi:hypothetical protein
MSTDDNHGRPVYPRSRSGYYRRPRQSPPDPNERYAVIDDEYVVYVQVSDEGREMLVSAQNWQAISRIHGPHWQVVKAAQRRDWEVVKGTRKVVGAGARRLRLARLLAKAEPNQQVRLINGDPLDLRDRNLELVDAGRGPTRTKTRTR